MFAVIGNPILFSKSPVMHRAGFKDLKLEQTYTRFAVDSAKQALSLADQLGFQGFNVTSPFKYEMYDSLSDHSPEALQTGAVNTVVKLDGFWRGFNTDVLGVQRCLFGKINKNNRRAVILGAGGAAAAAGAAIKDLGYQLTFANRTISKARLLAKKFSGEAIALIESDLLKVCKDVDLIVNTLTAGEECLPTECLHPGAVVLDAMYSRESQVSKIAKSKQAKLINGKEWLLEQGLAAFELFNSQQAKPQVFCAALDQHQPKPIRSIVLFGLSGAGKSSLAPELAKRLGVECLDLDDLIVERAGLDIPSIFSKYGEQRFRDLETEALLALDPERAMVVACGAGVVKSQINRDFISQFNLKIWLVASFQELANRLSADSKSRPLLQGQAAEEKLALLAKERYKFYADLSDLVLSTMGKNLAELTQRVVYEINSAS